MDGWTDGISSDSRWLRSRRRGDAVRPWDRSGRSGRKSAGSERRPWRMTGHGWGVWPARAAMRQDSPPGHVRPPYPLATWPREPSRARRLRSWLLPAAKCPCPAGVPACAEHGPMMGPMSPDRARLSSLLPSSHRIPGSSAPPRFSLLTGYRRWAIIYPIGSSVVGKGQTVGPGPHLVGPKVHRAWPRSSQLWPLPNKRHTLEVFVSNNNNCVAQIESRR